MNPFGHTDLRVGDLAAAQPWVESREDVERVAAIVREAGALDLSGPKEMPYGPGYYAAFFADPSGNRLEVYVRPPDDA